MSFLPPTVPALSFRLGRTLRRRLGTLRRLGRRLGTLRRLGRRLGTLRCLGRRLGTLRSLGSLGSLGNQGRSLNGFPAGRNLRRGKQYLLQLCLKLLHRQRRARINILALNKEKKNKCHITKTSSIKHFNLQALTSLALFGSLSYGNALANPRANICPRSPLRHAHSCKSDRTYVIYL